jgi:hypothetical protein
VLERCADTSSGRRVRGVWRLQRTTSGIDLAELPGMADTKSNELRPLREQPKPWFPIHELSHRQHTLNELRDRRIAQLPVVHALDPLSAGMRQP